MLHKNTYKVVALEFLLVIFLGLVFKLHVISTGMFIGLTILIVYIFMPITAAVENSEVDKDNVKIHGLEKAEQMRKEFNRIDREISFKSLKG